MPLTFNFSAWVNLRGFCSVLKNVLLLFQCIYFQFALQKYYYMGLKNVFIIVSCTVREETQ
jgi:hypothetical protein